jgi:hypothetical protein
VDAGTRRNVDIGFGDKRVFDEFIDAGRIRVQKLQA